MRDSSLRRSRVPRRTARRLRLKHLCRMFLCPPITRRLTALRLNPQSEESMTTTQPFRLASVVTAINVLVASGFSIVGIIRPQYLVPVESVPTQASLILAMYAAARTIPLALFALGAIYKQATPALLLLGSLAGAMQLLDAGIGLYEHDLGKCAGPLFIAVLQFFVVYVLHRSVPIRRKP